MGKTKVQQQHIVLKNKKYKKRSRAGQQVPATRVAIDTDTDNLIVILKDIIKTSKDIDIKIQAKNKLKEIQLNRCEKEMNWRSSKYISNGNVPACIKDYTNRDGMFIIRKDMSREEYVIDRINFLEGKSILTVKMKKELKDLKKEYAGMGVVVG